MVQCTVNANSWLYLSTVKSRQFELYACFSELEQEISAALLHQPRVIRMASLRNSGRTHARLGADGDLLGNRAIGTCPSYFAAAATKRFKAGTVVLGPARSH
jgi:hypothetical protein